MQGTINVSRCNKGAYTLVHDRNEYFDGWHDEMRIERIQEDGVVAVTPVMTPIKVNDYSGDTAMSSVVTDYTDEEYEAILDKEIAEFEA